MSWIALKMLVGDRAKYLGIVFGVTFAALLMTQQASIFWGLMTNTTSQIRDLEGADIWVMDPNVRFVDDIKPLSDDDLYRVRGVPGVAWGGKVRVINAREALPAYHQLVSSAGGWRPKEAMSVADRAPAGRPRRVEPPS